MESVAYFIIVAGLALALAIPLVILGIFLHRVRILKQGWKPILAKAMCALPAWAFFSFLLLQVDFIFVYVNAHTPPGSPDDVTPLLTLLTATIVYGLAGWGLCYWVGHARRVTVFDSGLTGN